MKNDPIDISVTRRDLLRWAGAGAAAMTLARAGAPLLAAAASTDKPVNVLVLMSDEHHPDVMSPRGHPLVKTPNFQRLADRGTVFDAAYCPSPLCSPCRSAYITGQRVHTVQRYSNCCIYQRNDETLGGALAKQNVHSVLIGKTDYAQPGKQCGFSEVFRVGDRPPPGDTEISRNPLAIRAGAAGRARDFGANQANPFGGDDVKTAAAVKWLRESAPKLTGPWSLTVNLLKPHFPQFVTKELWDQYAAGADLPKYGRDQRSANHPRAKDLRDHFQTDQFTDDQIRGLRRGYLGCVDYVDRQLGELMAALDAIGQTENTVIIYTSDHGDMLGKFGMWWKSSLYDDSARVPMIAAGPGFGVGQRVKTPVDLHDLRASIFHATGAEQPAGWCGSPLQLVKADDPDRIAFSEYHGHGTRASSYLIRRQSMKLIYHVDAPHQLFDLSNDPDELHDVYADKPAVAKDLDAELRKICDPEKENARAEKMILKQLAATGKVKGAE